MKRSNKICGECRHFNRLTAAGHSGECRWRPPTVLIRANGQPTFSWPGVLDHNWCGQWEIRPKNLPEPTEA